VDFAKQEEVLAEVQTTVWEIKETNLRNRLKKISGEIKKNNESEELEKQFAETMATLQKLMEQKALISSNHLLGTR
jgi:hypothetical protein